MADIAKLDTALVSARFATRVRINNGAHVTFDLFAATDGAHLGNCGTVTMRAEEYAAFMALLGPALTDRADVPMKTGGET